jgi:hypothetical protein
MEYFSLWMKSMAVLLRHRLGKFCACLNLRNLEMQSFNY